MHTQLRQLLNLVLLLILGKYVAHIYLSWLEIVGILVFTVAVEHMFIYLKEKKISFFSFSSVSTAIGVTLMMVTTDYCIYLTIILLALVQKQFFTYNRQHFFNPSNFALMLGLLFFYDDAHIVLGQMGDHLGLGVFVVVLGLGILYRAKRVLIPVVFSIIYILLQYVFIVSSDPVAIFEDIYYRFYSVSFIVFILFMLTDPKTTPNAYRYQILFASTTALVATLMDYSYGFRVQHLFMTLFLLSPFVVLLEQYNQTLNKKVLISISLIVVFLALSAIIYIEMKPPYYFEMDG